MHLYKDDYFVEDLLKVVCITRFRDSFGDVCKTCLKVKKQILFVWNGGFLMGFSWCARLLQSKTHACPHGIFFFFFFFSVVKRRFGKRLGLTRSRWPAGWLIRPSKRTAPLRSLRRSLLSHAFRERENASSNTLAQIPRCEVLEPTAKPPPACRKLYLRVRRSKTWILSVNLYTLSKHLGLFSRSLPWEGTPHKKDEMIFVSVATKKHPAVLRVFVPRKHGIADVVATWAPKIRKYLLFFFLLFSGRATTFRENRKV